MQTDSTVRAELVLAAVELMGRAGRLGMVRVQGESMKPTLHPGQRLAVDFAPERTARGDMLVFRQGEFLLVHRQVGPAPPREGRPHLRTRGDGVLYLDPPVDPASVVGRVVAVRHTEFWRSTRCRRARVYGWFLAWHDLFWAAVGVVLRRIDVRLGGSALRRLLRPVVTTVDRTLLRVVHAVWFKPMHPRVADPLS